MQTMQCFFVCRLNIVRLTGRGCDWRMCGTCDFEMTSTIALTINESPLLLSFCVYVFFFPVLLLV